MNVVFRCFGEQPIALRHQRLERREVRRRAPPLGMHLQLEPALVLLVDRLEKRRGLAGVDQHRNVEARARRPHRIELGVVNRDALAVAALQRQAEVLEDLQAARAGLDVGFEPRRGAQRRSRTDSDRRSRGWRTAPSASARGCRRRSRSSASARRRSRRSGSPAAAGSARPSRGRSSAQRSALRSK